MPAPPIPPIPPEPPGDRPDSAATQPTEHGGRHVAQVPATARDAARDESRLPGIRRYHAGRVLGRNDTTMVRVARDRALRRDVAVKTLHRDRPVERELFMAEARITAWLEHPDIVPVHEVGVDGDGKPFMAMQYIDGRPLREVIRASHRRGRLIDAQGPELRKLVGILVKLCEGLMLAHSRGVAHANLHPGQVLVGEFGEVMVLGWGHARGVQPTGQTRADADADAGVAPLPAPAVPMAMTVTVNPWTAPELIDRRMPTTAAVDVYGLGGLLYTVLTDQPPVADDEPEAMRDAILRHAIEPPAQRAPDALVPPDLATLAMQALASRPDFRPPDVQSVLDELVRFLDGEMLRGHRYGLITRARRAVARHTGVLSGALVTLLALCVGLAVVLVSVANDRQQRERERAAADERAFADRSERARAEADAEIASYRAMLQDDRIEELRRRLGVLVRRESDEVLVAFRDAWVRATRAGLPDRQFFSARGRDSLEDIVRRATRLIESDQDLAAGGTTPDDMHMLGAVLDVGLDRPREAIQWFNRAITLKPDHARSFAYRAMAHQRLGEFELALRDIEEALRLEPGNVAWVGTRGNIRLASGDYPGALADLDRTIADDPSSSRNWYNRGTLHQQMGNHALAERDLSECLRLNPNDSEAWLNRGAARLRQNNRAGAESDFTRAVELVPAWWEAWFNRGVVRCQSGRQQQGLDDLGVAFARCRDAQQRDMIARAIRAFGGRVPGD
ncbi:MAG: tetratricopeptide repeat protein [Planctomycetota bacterium]